MNVKECYKDLSPHLVQVSINLDASGNCQECCLEPSNDWSNPSDFPVINPAVSGRDNRCIYAATSSGTLQTLPHFPFDMVVKLNALDNSVHTWSVGPRRFIVEPIFVPKGVEEDDGYLLVVEVMYLAYLYNERTCKHEPAKNNLGIFTPTWFTSATFLNKDYHRKIVAGTTVSGHVPCLLTTKGYASMRSVEISNLSVEPVDASSPNTWTVSAAGNICSKVDENENYALFGGKGVEVNVWDLECCTKIWTAKSPAKNSVGIFTPTWFTSATFLNKDNHHKIVAGTNGHQVRLYDISDQRRPVMSFDFRETSIRAFTEHLDGHTIYFGNGSGDH